MYVMHYLAYINTQTKDFSPIVFCSASSDLYKPPLNQAFGGCTYATVFRAKNGGRCRVHLTRGRNLQGKYIFCLFDSTD